MTEAEWLTTIDPEQLATFRHPRIDPQKVRSVLFDWFDCALVPGRDDDDLRWFDAYKQARATGAGVGNPRDSTPVNFLDNQWARRAIVALGVHDDPLRAVVYAAYTHAIRQSDKMRRFDIYDEEHARESPVWRKFLKQYRCLFGNPFRPVTLSPAWLSSTAVSIAAGVYDDRAFDRLPILADALQDAGCEDAALLDHLRGDGPHARGCWALDLVLRKG